MTITAPAPWRLNGSSFISLLRMPNEQLDNDPWTPQSLRGKRRPSPFALMMFVDYQSSDVGPYHELLFVPGAFAFADQRFYPSISRILVSSKDSVVNGRVNWGIPKERADFDVIYDKRGIATEVTITQDGDPLATLHYQRFPLGVPVFGALIPERFRTLGQHYDGKTFLYAPQPSGTVQAARLTYCASNRSRFPDLSLARRLGTACMPSFNLVFPEARVLDQY